MIKPLKYGNNPCDEGCMRQCKEDVKLPLPSSLSSPDGYLRHPHQASMGFDFDFILQMLGKSSLILLCAYVVILIILRQSRYYRLQKCPKCEGRLSRHRRTKRDRWTRRLSLGILPVKRYRCYSCYWEGQAFNIKDARMMKDRPVDEAVSPTS